MLHHVLPRLGFGFVEFALKLHVQVRSFDDQPRPQFIAIFIFLLQEPVSNRLRACRSASFRLSASSVRVSFSWCSTAAIVAS